ncbi:hypothetical protein QWI29_21905 [Mycolicibacterium neoaurum]|uniref:hypothetical protein n=1 Tax=Mycolicibacterium neoaurum TaxID=1795 RepID=UPI0026719732|nr:hypothetical protein [Mycolicibacterium neoaurum]MDO3402703.1 hypothetical protein [Mycolicibacterium neoaurum]
MQTLIDDGRSEMATMSLTGRMTVAHPVEFYYSVNFFSDAIGPEMPAAGDPPVTAGHGLITHLEALVQGHRLLPIAGSSESEGTSL